MYGMYVWCETCVHQLPSAAGCSDQLYVNYCHHSMITYTALMRSWYVQYEVQQPQKWPNMKLWTLCHLHFPHLGVHLVSACMDRGSLSCIMTAINASVCMVTSIWWYLYGDFYMVMSVWWYLYGDVCMVMSVWWCLYMYIYDAYMVMSVHVYIYY